jgi:hypothetical protein
MKQFILILVCVSFSVVVLAQTEEQQPQTMAQSFFTPHYSGSSVDMGFMFTPRFGSGFYVAPKLRFQATPRLFINTGVSIMQYNLLPSHVKFEGQRQQTATGAYIFTEGTYLLNERWSINGSVMKKISAEPLLKNTPTYHMPSEAAHFGIDYKITPNITIGARVGYSGR